MTSSNSEIIISDDEAVTWLNESRSLARDAAERQGVQRNHRKRAKSAGINVRAMAAALRALKRSDPDGVISDLRDQIRYMQLLRLPVVSGDLFGNMPIQLTDKTKIGMDIWDAQDGGYKAGRHGAVVDECPYEQGSELAVQWIDWWHKGQASIAKELGPEGQQVTPTRGRRRRQTILVLPGAKGRAVNGEDTPQPTVN